MYLTEKTQLELWRLCQSLAFDQREMFHLPYTEAEDLRSETFAIARDAVRASKARKSRAGLLSSIVWGALHKAFRRRKTCRERMLSEAVRLDAEELDFPAGDTTGATLDEEPTPEWVYGVRLEESKLGGKERAIARRLKRTFVYDDVRTKLKLSNAVFRENLENLRVRFAQCRRAYHAWKAEKDKVSFRSLGYYSSGGRKPSANKK